MAKEFIVYKNPTSGMFVSWETENGFMAQDGPSQKPYGWHPFNSRISHPVSSFTDKDEAFHFINVMEHLQSCYEDLKKVLMYCCESVINFDDIVNNHEWYEISTKDVRSFKEGHTFKNEMDVLNKMDQYWFRRNSYMKFMIHTFQRYNREIMMIEDNFQIPPMWYCIPGRYV